MISSIYTLIFLYTQKQIPKKSYLIEGTDIICTFVQTNQYLTFLFVNISLNFCNIILGSRSERSKIGAGNLEARGMK